MKNNDMLKERNGEIDVLRFLFSLLILLYHVGTNHGLKAFTRGYIGVEFFFLVSGYLMADSVIRKNLMTISSDRIADQTWNYIKKRLSNIYPHYITAFVLQLVIRYIVIHKQTFTQVFAGLLRSFLSNPYIST